MHQSIGTVFKVLGLSIIFMAIMDISLMVFDTLTVRNRVETLAVVIQDELSRNNSIPNDIAGMFSEQLTEIVNKSEVATSITWNLNSSLIVDGTSYKAISEKDVVDYGEMIHLVIKVEMRPHSMLFYKDTSQNGGAFLGKGFFTYVDEYVYPVPALRYLK